MPITSETSRLLMAKAISEARDEIHYAAETMRDALANRGGATHGEQKNVILPYLERALGKLAAVDF